MVRIRHVLALYWVALTSLMASWVMHKSTCIQLLFKCLKTRLPVNRFRYTWIGDLHCIVINTVRLFMCGNLEAKDCWLIF